MTSYVPLHAIHIAEGSSLGPLGLPECSLVASTFPSQLIPEPSSSLQPVNRIQEWTGRTGSPYWCTSVLGAHRLKEDKPEVKLVEVLCWAIPYFLLNDGHPLLSGTRLQPVPGQRPVSRRHAGLNSCQGCSGGCLVLFCCITEEFKGLELWSICQLTLVI